jgi:hypothetical protein
MRSSIISILYQMLFECLLVSYVTTLFVTQDYTAPNDRMTVNYELEQMWKKKGRGQFKTIPRHLPT